MSAPMSSTAGPPPGVMVKWEWSRDRSSLARHRQRSDVEAAHGMVEIREGVEIADVPRQLGVDEVEQPAGGGVGRERGVDERRGRAATARSSIVVTSSNTRRPLGNPASRCRSTRCCSALVSAGWPGSAATCRPAPSRAVLEAGNDAARQPGVEDRDRSSRSASPCCTPRGWGRPRVEHRQELRELRVQRRPA